MNIYLNPAPEQWPTLCRRAEQDNSLIAERVEAIVERVREEGDEALKALAEQIDGVCLQSLKVQEEEFAAAEQSEEPLVRMFEYIVGDPDDFADDTAFAADLTEEDA